MPKLPRISGAEAQRALERLGFIKLRQSGSHVIMRRDSKGCVVPMHAELKVGTFDTDAQVRPCALRTRFVCAGQVRR
jgi:predicted RNA binding protein YcfA (HicA-like mRNA interferase family)